MGRSGWGGEICSGLIGGVLLCEVGCVLKSGGYLALVGVWVAV